VKVVLAGGSGALGRRVAAVLDGRGHDVVILTRRPAGGLPGRQVAWDGSSVGPWARELSGAALVNLCGAIVDRRPSAANVGLLTRSRADASLSRRLCKRVLRPQRLSAHTQSVDDAVQTMEALAAHDIDEAALADWITARLTPEP